jgi:hypothetical protein
MPPVAVVVDPTVQLLAENLAALDHLLAVLARSRRERQRLHLRYCRALLDTTAVQRLQITVPTVRAAAVVAWVVLAVTPLRQLPAMAASASQVLFRQIQHSSMQVVAVRRKTGQVRRMELLPMVAVLPVVQVRLVRLILAAVAVQVTQRQQQAVPASSSFARSPASLVQARPLLVALSRRTRVTARTVC